MYTLPREVKPLLGGTKTLQVDGWQWDQWNVEHLGLHGIKPRTVVEIAELDDPRFREDEYEEHSARLHMLGMDKTGKMWLVCIVEVNGAEHTWRAITGWEPDGDDLDWYGRNR